MKIQLLSIAGLISVLAFSVFLFGIHPWFNRPPEISRPMIDQNIKNNVKVEITSCYACHGVDGRANLEGAPNIAGQDREYLIKQLRDFRSKKRAHDAMNSITERLTDEQIEEISEHYANISTKYSKN